MKQTLKNLILNYLRQSEGYINGGEIEKKSLEWGYKGSTGSRICRKLAEDKILERKEEKGSVWYKSPAPRNISVYKVNGEIVGKQYDY